MMTAFPEAVGDAVSIQTRVTPPHPPLLHLQVQFAATTLWAFVCRRQTDRSSYCNTLERVEPNGRAPLYPPELLTSSSSEKMCSFLPPSFFPPQRPPDGKLEQLLNLSLFEASPVFAGPLEPSRTATGPNVLYKERGVF